MDGVIVHQKKTWRGKGALFEVLFYNGGESGGCQAVVGFHKHHTPTVRNGNTEMQKAASGACGRAFRTKLQPLAFFPPHARAGVSGIVTRISFENERHTVKKKSRRNGSKTLGGGEAIRAQKAGGLFGQHLKGALFWGQLSTCIPNHEKICTPSSTKRSWKAHSKPTH